MATTEYYGRRMLSELATFRLMRVVEWLEADAPHVRLENGVVLETFHMDYGVQESDCGAVCCIAGALVEMFDPFKESAEELCGTSDNEVPWRLVYGRAVHLLELGETEADELVAKRLFRSGSYDNLGITARVAAATLRHFLETGVIDYGRFAAPELEEEGDA